jgi:hypothetical protein
MNLSNDLNRQDLLQSEKGFNSNYSHQSENFEKVSGKHVTYKMRKLTKSIFLAIVVALAGCSNNTKYNLLEPSVSLLVNLVHQQDKCAVFELSEFLKTEPDYGTNGVFDTMYQRIQFHFESIERDKINSCIYHINGADRLKSLVTTFSGEVKIEKIVKNVGNIYDPKVPSDDKLVEFNGTFEFREDEKTRGSGVFSGTLYFKLSQNKENKLVDDMGEYMGDGFYNFTYEGTWTSYKTGRMKKFIWGQGRFPNTGDFDIGDGEMMVNEKYLKNGWQHDDNWRLIDNPKNWWKQTDVTQSKTCGCFDGIGSTKKDKPSLSVALNNGVTLTVCGYEQKRLSESEVLMSEFNVFDCATGKSIVQYRAADECIVKKDQLGLRIEMLAFLPAGEEWKWKQVKIGVQQILLKDNQVVVSDKKPAFDKIGFNQNQIDDFMAKIRSMKEKGKLDNPEEILGGLEILALNDVKEAGDILKDFENYFDYQTDGAIAEQWHDALATVQWIKK